MWLKEVVTVRCVVNTKFQKGYALGRRPYLDNF